MLNKVLFFIFNLSLIVNFTFAQKFGYVNTDFILTQMSEYQGALKEINTISKAWEKEISDMYNETEKKEIALKAEKIL